MIDIYSPTWQTVRKFIDHELEEAIQMLIADKNSDQQRGVILLLDRLDSLPDDPVQKVVADNYD